VVQKYPTGRNAISRQRWAIFIPILPNLYRRDPATYYYGFLQTYGCLNNRCHICNRARNNQFVTPLKDEAGWQNRLCRLEQTSASVFHYKI